MNRARLPFDCILLVDFTRGPTVVVRGRELLGTPVAHVARDHGVELGPGASHGEIAGSCRAHGLRVCCACGRQR